MVKKSSYKKHFLKSKSLNLASILKNYKVLKTLKYKLFLSFLFMVFTGTALFAQGISDRHFDAIKHADARTEWMTKALKLDTSQTRKIGYINREIDARYRAAQDKYPMNSKKLRDERASLEDERDERYEDVLTGDQMMLYKKEKGRHER